MLNPDNPTPTYPPTFIFGNIEATIHMHDPTKEITANNNSDFFLLK